MDVVHFFARKLYGLSGFVCVHIRQSHLCFSQVIWTYVVVNVIIVTCSLCVLLCTCLCCVLVKCLLKAFALYVGEVTVFSLKVIVLL